MGLGAYESIPPPQSKLRGDALGGCYGPVNKKVHCTRSRLFDKNATKQHKITAEKAKSYCSPEAASSARFGHILRELAASHGGSVREESPRGCQAEARELWRRSACATRARRADYTALRADALHLAVTPEQRQRQRALCTCAGARWIFTASQRASQPPPIPGQPRATMVGVGSVTGGRVNAA